jgi:SAM-dependent methyltransferase
MPESSRVERERLFHNSLVADGIPTIATREWWQSPGGLVRFRRRIELLQAELRRYENPRVLVVGCGDGEWLNEICRFAEVVGIDISDRMVARATSALREPKRASVEVGDAHNLRFAVGTFDICFANSTLHHLDLSAALPEIRRVLRIGGCLVAGEPNRSNPLV